MDASALEALLYDPSKCSKLSMEQKRELVYEVSKWPDSASEWLHAWSRHEILQILCLELGKERKYTGLTKSKMIEQLLRIIYEKKFNNLPNVSPSLENVERTPKRQRKSDHPNHLLDSADVDMGDNPLYCKNSACKAKMNPKDVFCKRCACCICRQYDDNKDPSLWLICNSEPPFRGASCGMSCHLECALKHENSGISQDRQDKGLDGSFCCVSCGKVNDLLSSWRKQLVVARDTRRVDILCYRLSLGQKILSGTKHYQNLYGMIDKAVKKLEEDVGPLTGLPVKKARGIVNRLSSGPEIQRLCSSAVEALDLMLSNRVSDMPSDCNLVITKLVRFEDISTTSLTVILNSDNSNIENIIGFSLWLRKAEDTDYPPEPTCRLFTPNTKFVLSNLTPATYYFLKVVTFNTDREMGSCELQLHTPTFQERSQSQSQSPTTNCSTLSNPSSVEDETNYKIKNPSQTETNDDVNKESSNDRTVEETSTGLQCVPYVDGGDLPITPCRFENPKEEIGRCSRPKKDSHTGSEPQAGSSSKKTSGDKKDFEYYVKVVRLLECEGHIETEFRQKFLTWYSLRATPQEVRVVKVFIDTFIEDPECLAGQLVDSFTDVVSNKRCSSVPAGFCMKLWH